MISLFVFLISTSLAFAQQTSEVDEIVDIIGLANQQVTRGNSAACNIQNTSTSETLPGECLEIERKSIADHLGRELPISVISEDRLGSLKNVYNSMMRAYDAEVCAQRADKIGDMLAQKGIESVKLYLEPPSFWPFYQGHIVPDSKARARRDGSNTYYTPYWKYHVVNMVLVRDSSGQDHQYIIDPFMEEVAVPREKWESRLLENPNSSISSQKIISRFNFGPGDSDRALTEYDRDLLKRSYAIMAGDK